MLTNPDAEERADGTAVAIHSASGEGKPLTIVSPRISTRQRLVALWRYRELLGSMTRNQLKVQYKNSVLGLTWSLVNPAVTIFVYFIVFQKILGNGIPRFAIFLAAGSLAWNFFMSSQLTACTSVVANGNIMKKVAFPREIPALANIGGALIQMGLQAIVVVIFMVAFRRGPAMEFLPVVIPALVALILLSTAMGILFAAVDVKYRDLNYLLQVALNVWFWATPIVYPYRLVRDTVITKHPAFHFVFYLYRLNPITPIVLSFQRAFWASTQPLYAGHPTGVLPQHAGPWWYVWQDLLVIGFALALLAFAFRVFSREEGGFAEVL